MAFFQPFFVNMTQKIAWSFSLTRALKAVERDFYFFSPLAFTWLFTNKFSAPVSLPSNYLCEDSLTQTKVLLIVSFVVQ